MQLDLILASWRIRATYGAGPMGLAEITRLLGVVMPFQAATPLLDHFKFEVTGQVGDYRIWLTDTRQWRQTITFDAPADPLMTFDVAPAWRESEFIGHRELRAYVTRMRVSHDLTLLRLDKV